MFSEISSFFLENFPQPATTPEVNSKKEKDIVSVKNNTFLKTNFDQIVIEQR
jgi:hypothetical protein